MSQQGGIGFEGRTASDIRWPWSQKAVRLHSCYTPLHYSPRVQNRHSGRSGTVCSGVCAFKRRSSAALRRLCHSSGDKTPTSHGRRLGWTPDQFLWGLWWTKWRWERVLSKNLGFPLSSLVPALLHQCSTHLHFYILLLSEGQAGEAREHTKRCPFGRRWAMDRKTLSRCFHIIVSVWGDCRYKVASVV